VILKRVLLLATALCVALLIAEGAVRVIHPGFPGFRLPQIEHRPATGLGFEIVPNQQGYTIASPARINAHGFRGPDVRTTRAPGDLRVLCLGDSMTFGFAAPDDVVFPRQLERLLAEQWPDRRPEVINAGVQRYFTYQEVDQLKLRGIQLEPDVVVLTAFTNDLGLRPQDDYVREFEKEHERASRSVARELTPLYLLARNSALYELLKRVVLSRRDDVSTRNLLEGTPTAADDAQWAALREELRELVRLSRQHRFRLVVVALPPRELATRSYPRSLYPRRLLEICQAEGIECVDLLPPFRESVARGTDPYLEWDNHLSEAGHRLVATALRDKLRAMLQ
jgi:lysophospholipase L1-like esterase